MNQLQFLLPIKPLSVNKKFTLHRKARILIKSKEAQVYEAKLDKLLLQIDDDLKELAASYKKEKHSISFEVEVFVPQHEFFTKQKTINQKCLDVTNAFKMLEDTIFKRLGIDDSQITQASITKTPWTRETWCCIIKLSLLPIPKASYLGSDLLGVELV
jgi:hypothetical protein